MLNVLQAALRLLRFCYARHYNLRSDILWTCKMQLNLFHKKSFPFRKLLALTLLLILIPPFNSAWAKTNPEITIEGGPAILRDNVRQYLTIANEKCAAPLWRLQSLLGEGEQEIALAAQAVGFYNLTFTTKLTQKNNCWQLDIHLTPGETTKINELTVLIRGDGENDPAFKELYENSDIKLGDRLHHGNYENLKSRILNMASSRGYYDGRFEVAKITVNTADNTAAINLIYDSGTRYRFGEIRFSHNILSEDFLRRYLNFNSGDYYDTDKLLELKNLYNASNYFNVATASPDIQHLKNYEVPIDVVLEERKRHAYSFGVGVATDTGPRFLLGFEDYYFNDSGHNIKADLSTSKIKTNTSLAYTIPMKRPSYEFLRFYTEFEREDLDATSTKNQKLGTSYTYYQSNHWLQTYALEFENETSSVNDVPIDTTNLIIPSIALTRIQTNAQPYPLEGWRLSSKLSGSPKSFGSDLSFLQFHMQAKYIYSLPVGRLLFRTEIGATKVNDFDELPVSKRFFAGGDASVRGYSYKSLGPDELVDPNDKTKGTKVVGGNNLLVGSVEYDFLVRPKWALATFYDAGNAANSRDLKPKRAAGIGLRWISPIGPVRIDIARALDDQKDWHFHITMGPDL